MFKTYLQDVWFSEKIFYTNFRSLVENKIYNLSKNEDNKTFNFTFLTKDIDKNECWLLWVEN